MLKTFFENKSFIKPKKIKKQLICKKNITPIKLPRKKSENIFNKITKTSYNLKKVINKKENNELNIFNLSKKVKNSRNINDNNGLNTDYINTTNNGNNSFLNGTYIKTTMDTNMTKTKIAKDKENISFINDNNTFIYFTPSTNYQSSNVKNKNKRKRIKIPKQKENSILTKNKSKNKNINNTFIIPNRINSLINVQQNILNPIKKRKKLFHEKSISLNKEVNKIKEKINIINNKRKSLDEKNILIIKSKIKNVYKLFENRIESISNKDKIRTELKKETEKLRLKINKKKNETNKMNINIEKIKEEIIRDKNEIIKFKKNIENINNDKKKVNAMLILLHKRIIDIKNRIKKHEEHNLYLDKSFFELNQKYQNLI